MVLIGYMEFLEKKILIFLNLSEPLQLDLCWHEMNRLPYLWQQTMGDLLESLEWLLQLSVPERRIWSRV